MKAENKKYNEIIEITLSGELSITISSISNGAKIFQISEAEAQKFGEAPIQLLEAKRYEYQLSGSEYVVENKDNVCQQSKLSKSRGTITTGNNVGTLELLITSPKNENIYFQLEVLATKFNSDEDYDESYRKNYRLMLESITEKCTELLMQANSPVNQYFEPNFEKDNKTIYQKFSFINSILNSTGFKEAVQKIISSPKTNWISKDELVDIRSIKRFSNKNIKDLLKGNNRIPIPESHPLYTKNKIKSIASKIYSNTQEESVDNPENRFVKHALQIYLDFCSKCENVFKTESKAQKEGANLVNKLESILNHSFFKTISRPTTLKLNSPSLQRKSGYRQVLKSWLMFDLASKLTWTGGEDVYTAGKRDIATLYEYWLFFVLYDLVKEKFGLNTIEHEGKSCEHLFDTTKDKINLIIKSGSHTALSGISTIKNRSLNIKFSFNRTFSGRLNNLTNSGSWTTSMRPDYTLSVWPESINEVEAEKTEQIVHIHFDSKYKVKHFSIKSSNEEEGSEDEKILYNKKVQKELNTLKKEERAGKYQNADLLKMHAYKDAIRRTGGAYILYPGTTNTRFKGFHELIPGLGAFSLNPANQEGDVKKLSNFIDDVIEHLVNNASQRENIASKTYNIHKNINPNIIKETIPEYINGEKLIPDETYVLVGYYKSKEQLEWVLSSKNRKYNFRTGINNGSYPITENEIRAKYLLLHGPNETTTSKIYELDNKGVLVYSKQNLIDKGYPTIPSCDLYLIYGIKENVSTKFNNVKFNLTKLTSFKSFRNSPIPITITLSELLDEKVIVK